MRLWRSEVARNNNNNNNTYLGIHKVPDIFVRFYQDFDFPPTDFHKIPQNLITRKTRPVGAEQIYMARQRDNQTNMTKLTVAFRQYANAPKNEARDANEERG